MERLTVEQITEMMEHEDWNDRDNAMWACSDRVDIPFALLEKGLHDENRWVHSTALAVCVNRADMPIALIEEIMQNESWESWHDRFSVMQACIGRADVPVALIKKGMDDEKRNVQEAAKECYFVYLEKRVEAFESLGLEPEEISAMIAKHNAQKEAEQFASKFDALGLEPHQIEARLANQSKTS